MLMIQSSSSCIFVFLFMLFPFNFFSFVTVISSYLNVSFFHALFIYLSKFVISPSGLILLMSLVLLDIVTLVLLFE